MVGLIAPPPGRNDTTLTGTSPAQAHHVFRVALAPANPAAPVNSHGEGAGGCGTCSRASSWPGWRSGCDAPGSVRRSGGARHAAARQPRHTSDLAPVKRQLSGSFFVVCPDLRGYGQSTLPPDAPGRAQSSKQFRMAMDDLYAVERLVVVDSLQLSSTRNA